VPTLNLQPQKTCPPGYHWVDTPAGPIMGVLGDLQARYLAGCVKDTPRRVIPLTLGVKAPAPTPTPAPVPVRAPVGTGVTSPLTTDAAPSPATHDTVEAPTMADTPALPAAECPAGLTWGGVAAAAGGSFFLGLLVGAVSFGGVGRFKKKKGRR